MRDSQEEARRQEEEAHRAYIERQHYDYGPPAGGHPSFNRGPPPYHHQGGPPPMHYQGGPPPYHHQGGPT